MDLADGATWSLDELLGDDPGEPTAAQGVWTKPDGLVAFDYDEDTGEEERWESADGVEWEAHHPPREDFAVRMGSGWVTLTSELAFYPVGSEERTVIDIAALGLKSESRGEGGHGMARVGPNTIVHSVAEDGFGRQRDH